MIIWNKSKLHNSVYTKPKKNNDFFFLHILVNRLKTFYNKKPEDKILSYLHPNNLKTVIYYNGLYKIIL